MPLFATLVLVAAALQVLVQGTHRIAPGATLTEQSPFVVYVALGGVLIHVIRFADSRDRVRLLGYAAAAFPPVMVLLPGVWAVGPFGSVLLAPHFGSLVLAAAAASVATHLHSWVRGGTLAAPDRDDVGLPVAPPRRHAAAAALSPGFR